ncbi:hypothetical protein [Calderihabitans maritimus]|uniref:Uncharacterized protein n=1 Tax=Calderihabitans maritimus TaxID=1246530 RepID=A0A1Z5HS09_9FIRM|nr:hypothetical protein [Calderihabitans maritimus]GAW92313.1 hypothetical protein KKC1_14690 [Calderihabitans maritimus]
MNDASNKLDIIQQLTQQLESKSELFQLLEKEKERLIQTLRLFDGENKES